MRFGEEVLGDFYTDDAKDVMYSVRDYPVTIAKSGNALGKSHSAARIAIWYYLCFPEAQVYLLAAPPLDNLKGILWGEIMRIVQKYPDLFTGDKIRSLGIYRGPLNFIRGVTIPASGSKNEKESRFSGKHSPYQMFVMDEADAIPEEVFTGAEGCMSGESARMLAMFNPRNQSGPIYLKEVNNQAHVVHLSAFNHPNVITGDNVIPGAVSRETTIRRINSWTRELQDGEVVDYACFEVPEFLIGATATGMDNKILPPLKPGYRKIVEPAFSYMVLGQYPPQGDAQLISIAWIEAARKRWDEYVRMNGEKRTPGRPDPQPILGVDVAELGADSNIAYLRYGGFVGRAISWDGVDPDMTAQKALTIYRDSHAIIALIDGTGVGSSVAPSMARMGRLEDVRAISVKVAASPSPMVKSELGEFGILRDQMWWMLKEWLRTDPTAMLPPDQMLLEELKVPTYFVNERGKIKVMNKEKMRTLLRRSPDRADALVMTFAPITRAKVVRLTSKVP